MIEANYRVYDQKKKLEGRGYSVTKEEAQFGF